MTTQNTFAAGHNERVEHVENFALALAAEFSLEASKLSEDGLTVIGFFSNGVMPIEAGAEVMKFLSERPEGVTLLGYEDDMISLIVK